MLELFAVIGIDDALIIGGLMAGGTALSSWLGNRNAKKQGNRDARLNYDYSLKMARHGPSASVAGLRKAGLNPILAATDGSFSSPQMPSVSGKGAVNGSEAGIQAANMFLQAKQTDINEQQTKSNIDLQDTAEQVNKSNAFKSFVDGITKLKTGGLSGGYAALHSLGTKLGFGKEETSDILNSFGFNIGGASAPDGKVAPTDVKTKNAPDDGNSSVEIPSHGAYDSKPYTGSRTGGWRASKNHERKVKALHKQNRYEKWRDYDKSFERMPNVRRSIFR